MGRKLTKEPSPKSTRETRNRSSRKREASEEFEIQISPEDSTPKVKRATRQSRARTDSPSSLQNSVTRECSILIQRLPISVGRNGSVTDVSRSDRSESFDRVKRRTTRRTVDSGSADSSYANVSSSESEPDPVETKRSTRSSRVATMDDFSGDDAEDNSYNPGRGTRSQRVRRRKQPVRTKSPQKPAKKGSDDVNVGEQLEEAMQSGDVSPLLLKLCGIITKNTAMMGDLAAEIHQLRNTIQEQRGAV